MLSFWNNSSLKAKKWDKNNRSRYSIYNNLGAKIKTGKISNQEKIDIQPLIDVAIKHQDENPNDAIKLLEVAQQLAPDDPLVEHKLRQLE